MTTDEKFMERAMELARQAVAEGNEPFGAVLVKEGRVIAEGTNKIHTQSDPTHHAELGLIRDYCMQSGIANLSEYTLYSNCEPCFMCSGALVWAKVGRLVFGAYDSDYCAVRHFEPNECSKLIFDLSPSAPMVTGGVLREEGIRILKDYFN